MTPMHTLPPSHHLCVTRQRVSCLWIIVILTCLLSVVTSVHLQSQQRLDIGHGGDRINVEFTESQPLHIRIPSTTKHVNTPTTITTNVDSFFYVSEGGRLNCTHPSTVFVNAGGEVTVVGSGSVVVVKKGGMISDIVIHNALMILVEAGVILVISTTKDATTQVIDASIPLSPPLYYHESITYGNLISPPPTAVTASLADGERGCLVQWDAPEPDMTGYYQLIDPIPPSIEWPILSNDAMQCHHSPSSDQEMCDTPSRSSSLPVAHTNIFHDSNIIYHLCIEDVACSPLWRQPDGIINDIKYHNRHNTTTLSHATTQYVHEDDCVRECATTKITAHMFSPVPPTSSHSYVVTVTAIGWSGIPSYPHSKQFSIVKKTSRPILLFDWIGMIPRRQVVIVVGSTVLGVVIAIFVAHVALTFLRHWERRDRLPAPLQYHQLPLDEILEMQILTSSDRITDVFRTLNEESDTGSDAGEDRDGSGVDRPVRRRDHMHLL